MGLKISSWIGVVDRRSEGASAVPPCAYWKDPRATGEVSYLRPSVHNLSLRVTQRLEHYSQYARGSARIRGLNGAEGRRRQDPLLDVSILPSEQSFVAQKPFPVQLQGNGATPISNDEKSSDHDRVLYIFLDDSPSGREISKNKI